MEWQEVERRLIARIHQRAVDRGACGLFTGQEDMRGVAALLLSDRGREFCLPRAFPTLSEFEMFIPHSMGQHGVHIHRGQLELRNPGRCAIVGHTQAEVHCDDGAGHHILLLHGGRARLVVAAGSFALVWQGESCTTIAGESVTFE